MKRTIKKFLIVFLCLATLFSFAALLSSCQENKPSKQEEKKTVIAENGVSYYSIVHAQITDKNTENNAKKLRDTIEDLCDCSVTYAVDVLKTEEQLKQLEEARQILIGDIDRVETKEVLESLAPNSWAVVEKGNKIVICANNNALLSLAVDWFIENCINASDKTVKITEKIVKKESFEKELPIVVDGFSEYQVVYPQGDEKLEYYASMFERRVGIKNIVSDDQEPSDYEIVLGYTNRTDSHEFDSNQYSIKTKDSKIYINAETSDVLYYALNYYIEHSMIVSDKAVFAPADYNLSAVLNNYFKSKWRLGLPCIDDGIISNVFNAGTGLADDRESDTVIDSYMHVVSNVEYGTFENYAKKLESFGFKRINEFKIENNDLLCYRLGGAYAYISYTPSQKYIRVIWDKSSTCEVSDVDYKRENPGAVTFYQYSLDYVDSKMNLSGTGRNCGMFYIIKLYDDSLILIDSGSHYQANEAPLKALLEFLYSITGTADDEALNIRFWYFTHSDSDHTGLAFNLLEYMKNNGYKAPGIDAVGFNFPNLRSNQKLNKDKNSYYLIEHINENYPDIKYLKLHTGMVFNIAEVKFEVLGTFENIVSKTGTIASNWDTNDTCTFVRLYVGGKSIMICGDICNDASTQKYHCDPYSDEYLKSDILQVSHHGINLLTRLYDACAPEYAFISHAYENIVKRTANIKYYNKMVQSDKLFFAGSYTTALRIENGEITVTKIPRYDNPTGKLDPSIK